MSRGVSWTQTAVWWRRLAVMTGKEIRQLLRDPVFREVRHYTRYLQKEFAPPQNNPALAAAIAAIALYQTELQENQERFGSLAGFTNTIQ